MSGIDCASDAVRSAIRERFASESEGARLEVGSDAGTRVMLERRVTEEVVPDPGVECY